MISRIQSSNSYKQNFGMALKGTGLDVVQGAITAIGVNTYRAECSQGHGASTAIAEAKKNMGVYTELIERARGFSDDVKVTHESGVGKVMVEGGEKEISTYAIGNVTDNPLDFLNDLRGRLHITEIKEIAKKAVIGEKQ